MMGNTVVVLNRATNTVVQNITISAGGLAGLAVSPSGNNVWVAEESKNSIGVISTATNKVTTTIPVGTSPVGITFTPNGNTAYVANQNSQNVSVINTSSKSVVATIAVGNKPVAI